MYKSSCLPLPSNGSIASSPWRGPRMRCPGCYRNAVSQAKLVTVALTAESYHVSLHSSPVVAKRLGKAEACRPVGLRLKAGMDRRWIALGLCVLLLWGSPQARRGLRVRAGAGGAHAKRGERGGDGSMAGAGPTERWGRDDELRSCRGRRLRLVGW